MPFIIEITTEQLEQNDEIYALLQNAEQDGVLDFAFNVREYYADDTKQDQSGAKKKKKKGKHKGQ